MRKVRTALIATPFLLGLYIAAYTASVPFRHPAANMAYFVYANNDILDDAMYCVFLPLYKIHKWAGGCSHNSDREDIVVDPDFIGERNQNYEDIPSLVGMSAEKAMAGIKGIRTATENTRGYDVKSVLPNCDGYYWLGDLPILIGVKNGTIIKTTLVKG